ncbi:phage late control D family protein [Paraburkholderia sp.]|uniref:phage late control D family protein n=1 Tax=Paraburkholderia sp. TaxID=1926495 RepID=UPI00286FAC0E|nr:phage late control D family protein [Paraburkholderia sp.]
MAWNTQPRTLEIVSNAIPEIYGKKIFEAVRFAGVSKLGRLSDYQLDVQTIDESGLYLDGLHKVVDTDKLIGQSLTVRIAVEGNGTLADGEINIGAGVREITGVISEMKCLGADNRRMQYRLRLRCFLWLATLNRENRHFRDMSVVDISKEILKKYTFKVRWDNVIGAGNGRRP